MTDEGKTTESTGTTAGRTAEAAKGDAETALTQSKEAKEKAAEAAGTAGAVALKGVQAGRQAVGSASGQVVAAATTTWTVLTSRKALVMGAGAGAAVLSAASYLAGRRSEQHSQSHGPVTRLTGGRI
ncbi:hypothetical protein [Streptomyces beijiangensis]|uniref:Uncharacterized protein n=1 Tax=Streptomyces beijiangensis TaxID=163361 RepID=A0A939JMC4_9ACTN|nr:hypothetical protein [Streptomyces beijiangensis]MBO0517772.1 hypothetical protein [Streptomyces beijiangensis]